MNREQINELNQDELIAYGQELGLDVDRRFGEEKLRNLILTKVSSQRKNVNQMKNFTGFPDENGEFTVPPGGAVVEVQTNQFNPYKRPIPLGVNGKFVAVPVETPVALHGKYLEVLRNAVRGEVTQKRDDYGRWRDHHNTRAAYPFTVLFENKSGDVKKVTI